MTLQDRIENQLREALDPERMRLVNESYMHNVPKGSETHFNLVIVSPAFEGKPTLARHRAVYGALGAEIEAGLHALTMKTMTPEEWTQAGGEVTNPAPPCLGGSKKD